MLVASATTEARNSMIVCEDIFADIRNYHINFIKYDRHYSRLVDEALLDEQINTKQYGTVTIVSSIHVR